MHLTLLAAFLCCHFYFAHYFFSFLHFPVFFLKRSFHESNENRKIFMPVPRKRTKLPNLISMLSNFSSLITNCIMLIGYFWNNFFFFLRWKYLYKLSSFFLASCFQWKVWAETCQLNCLLLCKQFNIWLIFSFSFLCRMTFCVDALFGPLDVRVFQIARDHSKYRCRLCVFLCTLDKIEWINVNCWNYARTQIKYNNYKRTNK